jgi:tetratricopeptide (TPR) repeat protein
MTEEEKYDLIEAYLLGSLTEEQRSELQHMQQHDPDFQAKMEEQQSLWEAVGPSEVNSFREMVGEVLAERSAARGKTGSLHFSRRILVIAAALGLLLAAIWWLYKPAPDLGARQFARHFSPPPAGSLFRDAAAEPLSGAQPAAQQIVDSLYRRGNYPQALKQLLAYGEQYPDARSSDYYFLLGVLYLSTDHAAEARAALERVEVGHPYDKKWYLALSYLKTGDLAAAEDLLDELIPSANPYQNEAAMIIEALSK